jgi:integrase
LRIGELLGLSVSHVDFLRRTISVERQRLQSGGLAPVKSKTSRRVVPVGQVVIDELAAHLARFPSHVALFTDDLDRPLNYATWKAIFLEACGREGGRGRYGARLAALLRIGADLRRCVGEAGPDGAGSFVRGHHAPDVCAPVAG